MGTDVLQRGAQVACDCPLRLLPVNLWSYTCDLAVSTPWILFGVLHQVFLAVIESL